MTSAMLTLYNGRLNWKVDAHYRTSNYEANRQWRWGTSTTPPQSVTALRAVLALDRSVTALVVHGYTDLVTPYFASTLLLDQLPDFGSGDRVRQTTYPGGHMFYSRDASRRRFRDDGERALGDALRGGRHATQEAAPSPASAATPAKQGSTR
jgi:carboxypeptidase C (cathepsin A)